MRLSTPWIALVVMLPFAVGLGVAFADEEQPDRAVMEFADPEIIESSGLVVSGGLVATVNDSGDAGRTFVVDLATGETVGGVTWGEAADVEALAPTADGLLVGDIGDNTRSRDSVELLEVAFARGQTSGGETRYRLSYPEGAADAEALLVHPVNGEVLIATKGIFSGELYAAPAPLAELPEGDAGVWEPVAEVGSVITDGAFFPDGRHLILRNYSSATIYSYPGLETVGSFDLPEQEQGEGISVAPDGRVYVSTEGQFTSLLRVPLPGDLADVVAPVEPSDEPSVDPSSDPGEPTVIPDGATQGEVPLDEVEPRDGRPLWPWVGGVLVAVVGIAVLVRSLRPR